MSYIRSIYPSAKPWNPDAETRRLVLIYNRKRRGRRLLQWIRKQGARLVEGDVVLVKFLDLLEPQPRLRVWCAHCLCYSLHSCLAEPSERRLLRVGEITNRSPHCSCRPKDGVFIVVRRVDVTEEEERAALDLFYGPVAS